MYIQPMDASRQRYHLHQVIEHRSHRAQERGDSRLSLKFRFTQRLSSTATCGHHVFPTVLFDESQMAALTQLSDMAVAMVKVAWADRYGDVPPV